MMLRIVPLICLALAACDSHRAELDAVRMQLSDPGSAEFGSVETDDGTTCGFVNAKNRLGGYVGFRAFIVKSGVAELEGKLGEFATRIPSECSRPLAMEYIDLLAGRVDAYDSIIGRE